MRTLYAVWSWILFTAIVVQVGLAGYGAFYSASKLGDRVRRSTRTCTSTGSIAHALFGYLVILAGLIFMIVGLIAGIGRWRLGAHGLLFGLLVLQMILAFSGSRCPSSASSTRSTRS